MNRRREPGTSRVHAPRTAASKRSRWDVHLHFDMSDLLSAIHNTETRLLAGRSQAFRSADLQEHCVATREGIEPSWARLQRATSPLGRLVEKNWQGMRDSNPRCQGHSLVLGPVS